MAIFRGTGGAGSANDDVTVTTVTTKASEAAASATAASDSATAAASSASSASSSATTASTKASEASSSKDTATTKASEAATSATNAASSAAAAASSAASVVILDEDDMASNSATAAPSQQSVKAYVDAEVDTADTLAELTDTTITSPADGAMLLYDTGTSKWIDNVMSGDATLADTGAITIANNAIETAMINADAVTNAKIADDSIDSEHYVDGSIDTAHIADDAVTEAKLANAINTAIAANTAKTSNATHTGDVTGATELTIASGAVETGMIADDAVTADKLANSINTEIAANTAKVTNATHTGDVTGATALTIANNAVTTAKINADAITSAKIADDAIDSEHYTDGSIDTAHIGDLQVTTAKIAADAITGAKIADDAINSEHYTDASIDTAHIADSQITTAKIAADAITSAKIADTAISEEHLDPTVISGLSDTTIATADHLMFFDATDNALKKVDAGELMSSSVSLRPNAKPICINGDMQVAQRGTSLTGQTGSGFCLDRFGFQMDTFGTWTMTQTDDGPTGSGFTHALKWDCTTADTSLGAGHFGLAHYRIEGQDLQLLKKGTSSAEKVTISFWVKSAKTGTYILELFDVDNSRQISQAYTISSANTWEQKILVFDGDTTGALGNDNGHSLAISWWLGAGSTYSGGTLNTSWASNTNANRAVGVVNLADSTSNDWYLTGVQIEVGEYTASTLPAFQHESFGDNLIRCQRYFQKYTQPPLIGSANAGNTVARASFGLITSMRTGATATHNGTFSWFYSNSHQPQSTAFSATYTDENTFEADVTMNVSGMTATHPCSVYQSGSASLDLSAEL